MKQEGNCFSLIDGHAQFFRAYYAIRTAMTSPVTGEPTHAVYGFVATMLKLMRETNPKWLAVAIDVSGSTETFRSEIYPDYKAQRDETPEDFPSQIERCLEFLEILGIPVYGQDGYEADDVIATITKLSMQADDGLKMKIISRDKDLTQLVGNRVEVWDLHGDKAVTPETVFKVDGVKSFQVVDVLSLVGDSSDNIPGVPGIGPKTAGSLIVEYQDLESIYKAVESKEIKGKRAENLKEYYSDVIRNQTLIKLVDDIPIVFSLKDVQYDVQKIDFNALDIFCRELGFSRFLKEFLKLKGEGKGERDQLKVSDSSFADGLFSAEQIVPTTKTNIVLSKKSLKSMVDILSNSDCFSFDTETTGLNPRIDRLCGISFSNKEGLAYYVPLLCPNETCLDQKYVMESLDPLFSGNNIKVAHNLKFDMRVLKQAGLQVHKPYADTMIASWVLDSSRSSQKLDALALAYLNRYSQPYSDVVGTGRDQVTFDKVELERASLYAGEDAELTFLLWKYLEKELLKEPSLQSLYEELELPLVMVLAEMESRGIQVDSAILESQRQALSEQLKHLKNEIVEAAPHSFNPDSPKQLAQVLFGAVEGDPPGLGLKPRKRGKTGPSTSVEVLARLEEEEDEVTPIPGLMLRYRRLSKLVSTYLVGLQEAIDPVDSRIHAGFHITGTATGRLSSSNPNLQNIPIRTDEGREIRHAFTAPAGQVFVAADYSQIELRMLAHLSEDHNLCQAFHEGVDIHRAVAAEIFQVSPDEVSPSERDGAKMVNFGIVYGITSWGLAKRLGKNTSQYEAQEIIDSYKNTYPGINEFLNKCICQAEKNGFVETIAGRRRKISGFDFDSTSRDRAFGERAAINSVVQGSAADLIKKAMLNVEEKLSEELFGQLILQIHDELILEVEESKAKEGEILLKNEMINAMDLQVPLEVSTSIGQSWYLLK